MMKIVYNIIDEKKIKAFMAFEPAHNGKNGFSSGGDSTYEDIQAETNSFQNHT